MAANQRLVVLLYAVHPTDRASTVVETAAGLAKLVGLSPTVFLPDSRQVIDAGRFERLRPPRAKRGGVKLVSAETRRVAEDRL